MSKIVCFGEVLWDIFPAQKKVGGAPLNVASRLKSFGNKITLISAIGKDSLGEQLLAFLNAKAITTTHIQVSNTFETGTVKVRLDENGLANYDIVYPSAWDNILASPKSKEIVSESEIFIFGSLAARNGISKQTLLDLIEVANFKVFDVNLRPPHYSYELLMKLMEKADLIKFNDEELFEICAHFGFKKNSVVDSLNFIAELTGTKEICVTKGDQGAVFLFNGQLYFNVGYKVKVVDTVGAGDSFLGTLIHYQISQNNPQKSLDLACAVGALVASKNGANPQIESVEIRDIISQ